MYKQQQAKQHCKRTHYTDEGKEVMPEEKWDVVLFAASYVGRNRAGEESKGRGGISVIRSVAKVVARMELEQRTSFDVHLVRRELERCDADQYESHQPGQLERDPEHRPRCPHVPIPDCVIRMGEELREMDAP